MIAENVRVVEGDVSEVLPGIKCDVVIANPPYIPDSQELPRDVAGFEPHIALFGGPTGMELPQIFISAAARLLKVVESLSLSTLKTKDLQSRMLCQ
jgi:release factor glutamine methyltransferase